MIVHRFALSHIIITVVVVDFYCRRCACYRHTCTHHIFTLIVSFLLQILYFIFSHSVIRWCSLSYNKKFNWANSMIFRSEFRVVRSTSFNVLFFFIVSPRLACSWFWLQCAHINFDQNTRPNKFTTNYCFSIIWFLVSGFLVSLCRFSSTHSLNLYCPYLQWQLNKLLTIVTSWCR